MWQEVVGLRRQPAGALARRGRAAGGGAARLDDVVAAGGAGLHGHRGRLPAAAHPRRRRRRPGRQHRRLPAADLAGRGAAGRGDGRARPGTTRCASARPSTTAGPGRSPGWRSSPGWSPRWSADRCSERVPPLGRSVVLGVRAGWPASAPRRGRSVVLGVRAGDGSTPSLPRTTWMQSPGHSFAESITSRRRCSGTSTRLPGASRSSPSVPLTYARPSTSNSKTSGAYCTQSPSPVQRSWSTQTCNSSVATSATPHPPCSPVPHSDGTRTPGPAPRPALGDQGSVTRVLRGTESAS